MKYLLNNNKFKFNYKLEKVLEALRDEISDPQKSVVSNIWGEKYLDYETISSTDLIEKGKFKLSNDDSNVIMNEMFNTDIEWINEMLNKIPDDFKDDIQESMNFDMLSTSNLGNRDGFHNRMGDDEKNINLDNLSFYGFALLYQKIFRKISLSESKSNKYILRDERGKPLYDDDNKIIYKDKEPGEIIFTNNYTNASTFFDDWMKLKGELYDNIFNSHQFKNVYAIFLDNDRIGNFDMLGDHKMYLYISDNPKDILNMSVSPFFTSCQELYKGGGHGTQYMKGLLSNVFDPNSVPAFIILDTPYIDEDGKYLSDFISLSRLLLRLIESEDEDEDDKLFFDQTYPARMTSITESIIQDYTSNIESGNLDDTYIFKPALDTCDFETLQGPYMDNLSMKTKKTININTKKIIIDSDISEFNIDPNKKLQELVIKTSKLPKNFFNVKMDVDYVKFQFMSLYSLDKFGNVITDSFIFDKCKLTEFEWESMKGLNVKKISFRSIEVERDDFPKEVLLNEGIEDLELIYSFSILPNELLNSNIKKLKISGDILNDENNRKILKSLKSKGVKIEKVGLVL